MSRQKERQLLSDSATHRLLNRLLVTSFVFLMAAQLHPVHAELTPGIGPHLAAAGDNSVILSYLRPATDGHELAFEVLDQNGTQRRGVVAWGDNWFVNWADFPSVTPIDDDRWAAHWLVRRPSGGYAYDIYFALSDDAGVTWLSPAALHTDDTDTEHGFVTLFADNGELGAVWLDGREMVDDGGAMNLRSARVAASGKVTSSSKISGRTCECCQTDVAHTATGPVAVYRNRDANEVRDIYISRNVDGRWLSGQAVHDDQWIIAGCPVNGPVVVANDQRVAVSWFTGANGRAIVKAAWSNDSGASFDDPIVLDDARPAGHVGAVLIAPDALISSWLCRADDQTHRVCYRTVSADGTVGQRHQLETSGIPGRVSVPQIARIGDRLLFVWTERDGDDYVIGRMQVPVPTD